MIEWTTIITKGMSYYNHNKILFGIFSAFVTFAIINLLLQTLTHKFEKSAKASWQLHHILLTNLLLPLNFFIITFFVEFFLGFAYSAKKNGIYKFVIQAVDILDFVVLYFFLLSIIREIGLYIKNRIRFSESKFQISTQDMETIIKILQVVLSIVFLMFILVRLGLNPKGLLAFGGASGVVIGFAAKDFLSNIFGGLLVYFDKPFDVGDWVGVVGMPKLEGEITEIGWRRTAIITFDTNYIYIPNFIFLSNSLENYTRRTHRRIDLNISLRIDDIRIWDKIHQDIRDFIVQHPMLDEKRCLIVTLDDVLEYAAKLRITCFCKIVDFQEFHKFRNMFNKEIADIIAKNGAEFAIPAIKRY